MGTVAVAAVCGGQLGVKQDEMRKRADLAIGLSHLSQATPSVNILKGHTRQDSDK